MNTGSNLFPAHPPPIHRLHLTQMKFFKNPGQIRRACNFAFSNWLNRGTRSIFLTAEAKRASTFTAGADCRKAIGTQQTCYKHSFNKPELVYPGLSQCCGAPSFPVRRQEVGGKVYFCYCLHRSFELIKGNESTNQFLLERRGERSPNGM